MPVSVQCGQFFHLVAHGLAAELAGGHAYALSALKVGNRLGKALQMLGFPLLEAVHSDDGFGIFVFYSRLVRSVLYRHVLIEEIK